MRLFIAIDIDDRTRAQFTAARDAIERVVRTARVPPRITWVKPEAAHVTLRFIGETADDDVPAIQQALSAVRVTRFTLTWETVGTFGGTKNPRVIWIAPTDGRDACIALATHVNAELDRLTGPGEARPFKPHLTLGRVREPGRQVDWPRALAAVHWTPTVTTVARVVLYRSRLSPKGATYTAVSAHG
jgi:2'-5' RNA ligase